MPLRIDDLNDPLMREAAQRTQECRNEIDHTLDLIAKGRGPDAESPERRALYAKRQDKVSESSGTPAPVQAQVILGPNDARADERKAAKKGSLGFERKIGPTNDFLSVEFLEAGQLAARSVGRIICFGFEYGTAFHVGHGVIMTNHHVFNNPEDAEACVFELNAEANRYGDPKREFAYSLVPEQFFLTNENLDYTLVAVQGDMPMQDFGWHTLLKTQGKIRKGDAVNIIQHPDGDDKQIVLHHSNLLHLENDTDVDPYCWYSGDTEEGSSGAPVFNNRWEVIALHHKAVPKTNKNGEVVDRNGRAMSAKRVEEKPEEIAWYANEGIRVSRLVKSIEQADFSNPDHAAIRDQLITLWSEQGAHNRGLTAEKEN